MSKITLSVVVFVTSHEAKSFNYQLRRLLDKVDHAPNTKHVNIAHATYCEEAASTVDMVTGALPVPEAYARRKVIRINLSF